MACDALPILKEGAVEVQGRSNKQSIAVIGAGVSGICAAYFLHNHYAVTLFEKNNYLGGHTNTFVINDGQDRGLPIDTGFIVLNDKTYPNFHRVLAALGVEVRYSDMSFGFECKLKDFCYAGTGLNGLFAQRKNFSRPWFYSFLAEIRRFCRDALRGLEENTIGQKTLKEYLRDGKYSDRAILDYIIPMGAAIWSSPANQMLEFPAETFIRFFKNHGLLVLKDRPRWQTVVGGSHSYVRAFQKSFNGKIVLNSKIESIRRSDDKVSIRFTTGEESTFDKVVLAVHADQVLGLLGDATQVEKELFEVWQYQRNSTILHSDTSLMPMNRRAWASWNYSRIKGVDHTTKLVVTYHMNRLQGLKSHKEYLVTLNADDLIDNSKVHIRILYEHPVFTRAALKSRERIIEMNGKNNIWYCGSYFGYGFHEDGVNSAQRVADQLGASPFR